MESVHLVSVAVADPAGRLVATSGEPRRVTFWRSAAKPFQALPLIQDGAADRFGLDDRDLAIASASHSSEPFHLEAVGRFLAKAGLTEDLLACGPHQPLGPDVADRVIRDGVVMTARWSNCSGKHTGLLALAKHHGWPTAGYQRAGHPVQHRLLAEIVKWTGLEAGSITQAVDGCTTICYGLGLDAMATAYARLAVAEDAATRRWWRAVTTHPELVAGTGRLCTELMQAWPGEIFAKIGADGVYCAAIPSAGLGLAIKVHDGDMRSVGVALLAVIRQVLAQRGRSDGARLDGLGHHGDPVILNTRGEETGRFRAAGRLVFSA